MLLLGDIVPHIFLFNPQHRAGFKMNIFFHRLFALCQISVVLDSLVFAPVRLLHGKCHQMYYLPIACYVILASPAETTNILPYYNLAYPFMIFVGFQSDVSIINYSKPSRARWQHLSCHGFYSLLQPAVSQQEEPFEEGPALGRVVFIVNNIRL